MASFSKRRRQATQVPHPDPVRQLKAWLATKNGLGPDDRLFPVFARAGGLERKTHKVFQLDLEAARKASIKEAKTEEEKLE